MKIKFVEKNYKIAERIRFTSYLRRAPQKQEDLPPEGNFHRPAPKCR